MMLFIHYFVHIKCRLFSRPDGELGCCLYEKTRELGESSSESEEEDDGCENAYCGGYKHHNGQARRLPPDQQPGPEL